MENKKVGDEIVFIKLLRALAIVFVFISHILFKFWNMSEIVQDLCQTPSVEFGNVYFSSITNFFLKIYFDFGQFGVGLFFLISGFTLSLSMDKKYTIKDFLIRKFLRIYFVYWVGLGLTMIIIYIFKDSSVFKYSIEDILINSTLFRPFWHSIPTVDGINWYLEILIPFLIITFLYDRYFSLKKIKNFIIFTILILFFKNFIWLYFFFYLILVGFIFANVYKGVFTKKELIILIFALFSIFTYRYYRYDPANYLLNVASYLYSIFVFVICFYFRDKIKINKVISYISDISFSVYVVHGFAGYVIMANLYQVIQSYWICVFVALIYTIVLSVIIHNFIENKFYHYSLGKYKDLIKNKISYGK